MPVALIGLIYPFILLINVIFTIYCHTFQKHFWQYYCHFLVGHIQNLITIQDKGSDRGRIFDNEFQCTFIQCLRWIKKTMKQEISVSK